MEAKEHGDRPINVVTKRLEEIQNEKEILSNFSSKQYEIEKEKQKLELEVKEQENELELLKELRALHEKQELEKEKVKVNENMQVEYKQKIKKLQEDSGFYNESNKNEKNEEFANQTRIKKIQRKIRIAIALSIVFFIVAVVSMFVIKNIYVTAIGIVCVIVELIYSYTQNKKKTGIKDSGKTQNVENVSENLKEEIEEKLEIKKEIEILTKSVMKLEEEIRQINQKLEQEFKMQIEILRNKYMGKVPIKTIDEKLLKQTVIYDINVLQNKISENKLKLHSINLDKNNILPKLENLASLEEEYSMLEEQYNDLCKKNEQIELVKEEIGKAYETMKSTITPKFTTNLSKIIEKITNGKYKNIRLDETNGMIVEIENGNYISAKNLSVGTIDELYLSLRLGAGLEISNETLPIILDETFAYWDDTRLQNILMYLNEEFEERQIILFTCTNREEEILNKASINYNKILL